MTAPDLLFVHRYLPPTDPGVSTTLLMLHGTGGTEDDLVPLGRVLVPGAGILSPRGRILEHGMPRFFRRFAEGVFDLDDLRAQTQALADFVGDAASRYGFDPAGVTAAGYSNGANIAASLLFLRPEICRRAVLWHAQLPFEPTQRPDLRQHRVIITAGRRDPIVPPASTTRLAEELRSGGADVALHWFDGGHALTEDDVVVSRSWVVAGAPGS